MRLGPSGKGRVKGINHSTFLPYVFDFFWFWFEMLLLKGISPLGGRGKVGFWNLHVCNMVEGAGPLGAQLSFIYCNNSVLKFFFF